MSDDGYKTNQEFGTPSDTPASGSASTDDRPAGFDCCGTRMGEAMAGCPCGSIMKRHPVVTFAILAFVGLAVLVIPACAILGIIAFLRSI
jgi:hypothetical protein